MFSYPLPISPRDPAFVTFCLAREMAYIGAERWRYTRALRFPAWAPGATHENRPWSQWTALDIHPQTPAELQARLDQLDDMEAAAITRDSQTLWAIETAAMIANQPH